MKLIIDIPESIYDTIESNQFISRFQLAILQSNIRKGIPLPKGHGNLIQREYAEAIFKNARKALYEQSKKERIKDLETREMMLLNAEQFVHMIEPVIKAESEDKE